MQITFVRIFGFLIAALALLGMLVEGRHALGLMNADMALDMIRVLLAATLLYIGFNKDAHQFARPALMGVGILYVSMAVLGLLDPQLFDLLPTGLTGFDMVFHLVTGVLAIGVTLPNVTGPITK